MYATVFKPDPLDPKRGKLYREKILGPGGSRDDIDGLKVRRVEAVLIGMKYLIYGFVV